jgi:hypothetical protein
MKGHTLRFVHDAMAGQDRLHIPLWALFALAGAGQAIDNTVTNNANNANQRAISQAEVDSRERMHGQDVLLEESKANPFRGQMNQAASLASLDELERGSYTPVQLSTEGNPYASYIPKVSGGYSYSKSPELTAAAGALKNDVLAGHGASSVLRPDIATNRTPAQRRLGTGPAPAPDYNDPSASVVLNLLKLIYGEDPTHPNPVTPSSRA